MSLPRTATGFVSDVRSGRFAMPTTWERAKALIGRELNFYRVHLLAFTFVSISCSSRKGLRLIEDPLHILRDHVRYQYRISDPLYRLLVPLRYQYDSQWLGYGGSLDSEYDATGHHVLANAHWVFGTLSVSSTDKN